MRWLALVGLLLLAPTVMGCGGEEPTGGDCTPRTEDFVDDRLVPATQLAEASKTGELNCALICPPGTTACQPLVEGAGGMTGMGGSSAGGMAAGGMSSVGGMAAGGRSDAGGMSAGGNAAGGMGGAPSGEAVVVRCSGTVSYPCG